MKKIISLLLVITMVLSLCACEKEIPLTTENIQEYLSVSAIVEDCEIESSKIFGITFYDGKATLKINTFKKSNVTFQNVTIKCKVYTGVETSPSFYELYGWEFNSGNKQTGTTSVTDENYKIITIDLPYNGEWSGKEKLTLEWYEGGTHRPYELGETTWSGYGVEIVEVTGTVVKN